MNDAKDRPDLLIVYSSACFLLACILNSMHIQYDVYRTLYGYFVKSLLLMSFARRTTIRGQSKGDYSTRMYYGIKRDYSIRAGSGLLT